MLVYMECKLEWCLSHAKYPFLLPGTSGTRKFNQCLLVKILSDLGLALTVTPQ